MGPEDAERVQWLRAQAFGGSPDTPLLDSSMTSLRVLTVDGDIQGIVALKPWAHWFGGRAVPACGVASVTIAPESRGRGLSQTLMNAALAEMRDKGAGVSLLYPSTYPAYRRVGYEIAGVRNMFTAPLHALPGSTKFALEPWDDRQLDEVQECYRRAAQVASGLIDRPSEWWADQVLRVPEKRALYRYLVRRDGRVTGYVIFTQAPAPAVIPYEHDVECRDLVWLDADAARALLGFFARDSFLGQRISWPGPPDDPLLLLMPDRSVEVKSAFEWMLRIVDLKTALEARGYPMGLDTEFVLDVSDPAIKDNQDAWRVRIANGRAEVERGGDASASTDIGALAAIYTGWLTPAAAVKAGRLRAQDPATLDALQLAFAGPTPWTMEMF